MDATARFETLSTLETGQGPSLRSSGEPVFVDLNDVVARALEALLAAERRAAGCGAGAIVEESRFLCLLDPAIAPVRADEKALVLAVSRLVQAVAPDAEPPDEFAPAVQIITFGQDDEVLLEVGHLGGDATQLLRGARQWAGEPVTGLGGRLDVRGGPSGTRLLLHLPAVPWQEVSGWVAVLEDEPAVRDVIGRLVRRLGLTVAAAASYGEMRDLIEASATRPGGWPALLIIETCVRAGRSRSAAERIIHERPDLAERIVLLTSSPWTDEVGRLLALLRRQWYLAKPFGPEVLLALVRRRLMCLQQPRSAPPRRGR